MKDVCLQGEVCDYKWKVCDYKEKVGDYKEEVCDHNKRLLAIAEDDIE